MIKNYLFWNLIDLLNSEYNLPKIFPQIGNTDPTICNMRVLIISCSSSLFESIFSTIFSTWEIWTCMKKSQSFPMPYSVNVTLDKDLSVLSKTFGGVLMLLLIKGTLFDKKSELNNSAFCLKSLINLFTWKSDIFLLFSKDLR